jgi:hypothetical protein
MPRNCLNEMPFLAVRGAVFFLLSLNVFDTLLRFAGSLCGVIFPVVKFIGLHGFNTSKDTLITPMREAFNKLINGLVFE